MIRKQVAPMSARKRRALWALSITLMTTGAILICYAPFAPPWSADLFAYALGSVLLSIFVIVQTAIAAHADRRTRR